MEMVRKFVPIAMSRIGRWPIKAMEHENEKNFDIFNIGNPDNKVNLKRLAEMVCRIYGGASIEPKIIGSFENTDRSADRKSRDASAISARRATLGYQPQFCLSKPLPT